MFSQFLRIFLVRNVVVQLHFLKNRKQNPKIFSAPGQMKTQKEALALKLKIDQLRELQALTAKKTREAEMRREGIPLNKDEERGYKDRRFNRDDRGRGGDRRNDRDDRRGNFH